MNGDDDLRRSVPPPASGFRNILRNSATLIGARVVSKFAMTVFMVILARQLGTEDFGVYSSILAFIAFFSILEEFGMTPPMIRRISRARAGGGAELGRVVGLKAALGIAAYGLLLLTAFLLDVSPGITVILGISMIFEVLALTVTRAFEAYEMMKQIAVITIVERVLLGVTGLGAVFLGLSLQGLSYAYLLTFICSFLLATWMFRRSVMPFRPVFPRGEWRGLLREAAPFLTASVLSIVWTRSDIYFLTTYRSPAEVGWYTAALRIVEAQIFIPVAVLSSVFPVLSRLYTREQAEFTRIFLKNLLFLAGLGIPLAGGVYLFSAEITRILFGPEYSESAHVLNIFAPAIVLTFINYLLGGALVAMGRERLATATLGLGALLCVVCGFIFIPDNGGRAAGYIKLAAEGLSFLFQGVLLVRFLKTAGTTPPSGRGVIDPADRAGYETVTSGLPDE